MKTNSSHRLNRRLWRAFVFQIVLISATAIAAVYVAEFAIREILIVSALEREADYYWARQNIDPDTPAPNTHSLIGYVFDATKLDSFPEEFQGLTQGIHDLSTAVGQSVVFVSDVRGHRLFLVFDANNIRQLATYFGLVPLTLLLIVLYTSAWLAYRLAGRAVSPVVQLAREVRDLDLNATERLTLSKVYEFKGADDEVITLSHALEQLVERVNQFVERERIFTRETSHEIRSPLTVIKIASEMLLSKDDLSPSNRAMADKIHRAAKDMDELTQAFLLLAREGESGIAKERLCLNDIVEREIARCDLVYREKNLTLAFHEKANVWVSSSPMVVAVIVGNLIRNACAYTDKGHINVSISAARVRIEDTGIGISDDQLKDVFSPYYSGSNSRESGHGIGLNLVKRMTDRFGWPLEISSRRGRGTVVEVSFPDAEFELITGL
ncbi:MAG: signal transduction histidine kinase [Gammaproteobacteria bacterium]|jgi:signal transduction histidine kinase